MELEQLHWSNAGWNGVATMKQAHLVLIFGGTGQLTPEHLATLRTFYPEAMMIGCSTAGEIIDVRVHDDSLAVTAITFDSSRIKLARQTVASADDSRQAGETLAGELLGDELKHVFLLSDGLKVNGTELVNGLKAVLPPGVEVTGGLSGDGANFQQTLVIADDARRNPDNWPRSASTAMPSRSATVRWAAGIHSARTA
jgi:hypothetical protein